MPDHIHAVINPLRPELSTILRKWKGKSARLILNRLIDENEGGMLERLRIDVTNRRFALWQARSSIIDLVSGKFVRQKISYIHDNPVRAGLCDNPWDWKWSSYRGLHPAITEPMGLQPDLRWQWTIDEIAEAGSD
jgi:REP element-mobilizing transposase RayT